MDSSLHEDQPNECDHSTTFHECGNNVNGSFGLRKRGMNLDFLGCDKRRVSYKGLYSKDPSILFQEDVKSLISQRKLRLVMDLDETLIHTEVVRKNVPEKVRCRVTVNKDQLIYRWIVVPNKMVFSNKEMMFDHNNGNVKYFTLGNCTYRLYVRPNLERFIQSIYEHYEIFVYTHGTVKYAKRILNLIGIQKFISGVYGRKNSNEKKSAKSLGKILCSNKLSIIVDDKDYVWASGDRKNVLMIKKFVDNLRDNELYYVSKFLVSIKNYFYFNNMNDVKNALNHYLSNLS